MLKRTKLSQSALKALVAEDEVVGSDGDNRADETAKNLSKSKKSKNNKSENLMYNGAIEKPLFLTPIAKKIFNYLRQAFVKALILQHFDSKCHIQIETNSSSHAIGEVLIKLTPDQLTSKHLVDYLTHGQEEPNLAKSDLGQWHLIAYFFKKIILTKI